MILYLVHDSTKNTYSQPLVGPDLETVQIAFTEMNPENLNDLDIIVLENFSSLDDLKYLRINYSLKNT